MRPPNKPKFILKPVGDEEELANSDDMIGIYDADADVLVGFFRRDTEELALPSAAKLDDLEDLIRRIREDYEEDNEDFIRALEEM